MKNEKFWKKIDEIWKYKCVNTKTEIGKKEKKLKEKKQNEHVVMIKILNCIFWK